MLEFSTVRSWVVASTIFYAATIGGCRTFSEQQAFLDDAINAGQGLLAATGAAHQVAQASAPRVATPAPTPLPHPPAAGTAPSPTGYNQRESFEDCAKMFRAAGDPNGAAICAARAQNMQSIPMPR